MASPASAPSTQRAQLIHIEVDRRLGHEWDEWNGWPLPRGGDFSAAPGLFFRFAALTVATATGAVALLLYLIGPRLGTLSPLVPRILWIVLGFFAVVQWLYLGVLAASFYSGRNLLPERLLERGPYLQLMNYTSLVARPFGKRDWAEHAAIDVYNTISDRWSDGSRGSLPQRQPEQTPRDKGDPLRSRKATRHSGHHLHQDNRHTHDRAGYGERGAVSVAAAARERDEGKARRAPPHPRDRRSDLRDRDQQRIPQECRCGREHGDQQDRD